MDGKPLRLRRPIDAMNAGISYVPENRAADAAFLDLEVFHNIAAASIPRYWQRFRIASRKMRRDGRKAMSEFLVKAPAEDVLLSTLSGGNQQKVIVARWLRREPIVLLLDEPTQGVDVGARAEIYTLLRRAVAGGASAIIVASDLEELSHVCDRALVMRNGRLVAEVPREEMSAELLTQLAYKQGEDQP
jgi:ribose transport system ATP-binding protein